MAVLARIEIAKLLGPMHNLVLDLVVLVKIILVIIILLLCLRVKLLVVLHLAGARPLDLQTFGLIHQLSISPLHFGSLRGRHLLLINLLFLDLITKVFFVSLIGRGSFEFSRSCWFEYALFLLENHLRLNVLLGLLFWLWLRFYGDVLLALIRYEGRLNICLIFYWLFAKYVISCHFQLLISDLNVIQFVKPRQVLEHVHSVVSQIRAYRILSQIQHLQVSEILQISELIKVGRDIVPSKIQLFQFGASLKVLQRRDLVDRERQNLQIR